VQPGRITMAAVGRRPSFFDSRPGETFLRRHLGMRQLQHAPVPVAIVATNLHDGRPVVMTDGDAASAVVASCSFPAIYPPVRRGDQWLIDGGVVADIPLDIAADQGAASALVLSVPPLAAGPPRLRAIDLLLRASTFGVEAHGRTVMRRPPAGLDVMEVHAPPSATTTFAIGTTHGLVAEAYEHTREWLARDDRAPDQSSRPAGSPAPRRSTLSVTCATGGSARPNTQSVLPTVTTSPPAEPDGRQTTTTALP